MHRLALGIGCTVRELLQRLDLQELLDWIAYERLEPWGEARADLRLAVQLHYTLSPWLPADQSEPPNLVYPYFHDDEDAIEKLIQAQEAYRQQEANWAAELRRNPKHGQADQ